MRFNATPTYAVLLQIVDELAAQRLYERRLWDFSLAVFDLPSNRVEAFAEYGKAAFARPSKAAFWVPDDLSYGNARVYAVYRGESGRATVGGFREERAALEWLNPPIQSLDAPLPQGITSPQDK